MTPNFADYTFTSTCVNYYRSLQKKDAINRLERLDKPARQALHELLKGEAISNIKCVHLSHELERVQTQEKVRSTNIVKNNLAHLSAKKLFTLLNHFPLLSDTRLFYLPQEIFAIILGKIAPASWQELPNCLEVIHFLNPKTSSFLPKESELISWLSEVSFPSFEIRSFDLRQEHMIEIYKKTPTCYMTSIPKDFNQTHLPAFLDMHQSLKSVTITPSLLKHFLKFQELEEITLTYGWISAETVKHLESFKSLKCLSIHSCLGDTDEISQNILKLNIENTDFLNFM